MDVELVTTGAELLNGRVINRHAQWLGNQLTPLGWRLVRDTTVPDDLTAMREAIFSALDRVDVVIVTGGLGPTSDDVTREIAADWMGTGVVMHEPTRTAVIASYRSRNKPLNSTVERHALVVQGAHILHNAHGMAPGEYLAKNEKHLFLLPGPPREFHGVMTDHVLPWFAQNRIGDIPMTQLFQTAGLGESDIAARLEDNGYSQLNVETAYCAEPGRVVIRITQKDADKNAFESAASIIHNTLGRSIYSEMDETIEATVARLLVEKGKTIAVAESCTGGMLGQRLTAVPGASGWMKGGIIAYHNDVKSRLLEVDPTLLQEHGAVSEPVAYSMAQGVRKACQSDYGIGITGIAGPDGGTPDKPVGLVYIAVVDAQGGITETLRLGRDRETNREASATLAMHLLISRIT
ncbi:MAG TPA: competence/damage-inducible protein A [Kiritimatiellia bacterium]|nr:competence/damage-inducible protein A [Kiritimatiellia bacterium]